MLEISRKLPGNCVRAKNSQGSRPDTSTHYATQTILIWVLWTCVVGWCPWLSCTEHTTCVSHPGLPRTFPETSRKRPGGPGGGAPGDEDGCTGRIGLGRPPKSIRDDIPPPLDLSMLQLQQEDSLSTAFDEDKLHLLHSNDTEDY